MKRGLGFRKSMNETGVAGTLLSEEKKDRYFSFKRDDNGKVIKIRHFKPFETETPTKEPEKTTTSKPKAAAKIAFLEALIKEGTFTKDQIIEKAQTSLNMPKSTLNTLLADGQNPKYNRFSKLITIKKGNKIVTFLS